MTRSRILFLAASTLLAATLATLPAWGQATAIIRGTVEDETGAVIPGARVEIWNPLHPKHRLETKTAADGTFVLLQVPFNPYRLTVEKPGFQTHQATIDVHTATLTLEVTLPVGTVQQTVEVSALLLDEALVSTHVSLDEHELVRKPGAAPSRLIESAILESAGIAQNANGRLHVRGAHYQVSFMIDGLPISDQLSIDFGNPFDMRNVEALEVYTGNFPAEFGNKVSGVVNVSTKSSLGKGDFFHGSLGGSLGSFDAGEGSVEVGGGTERWGYYASLAGGQTHRFLDPVSLDNLHNGGNNQSLFTRLDFAPTSSDFLHLMVTSNEVHFESQLENRGPNSPDKLNMVLRLRKR